MDQFERLENIFKNNNNKGMAVAITGQWGIGKTFFWNKFINERAKREEERKYLPFSITQKHPNLFNKKYTYISLFGVESVADLKTTICTKLSSNHFNESSSKNIETPILLKKFISQFRDIKVSKYGVSASARLIESFLFAQVSNAIICFDDFERMSKKLDIKDVMGLANQLKLEKNCQIILILDESKNEGENKSKYAEYQEKLVDEEIKVTSVEPLIRDNTKDMNEPLVDLMVKFADGLEIHNFRFFQKVIKLYRQFLEQLPDEIAYSTKEIILIRILQGYFIEESGLTYEFHWHDVKLVIKEKQKDWSDQKLKTYKSLETISYDFIRSDEWLIQFKKWFDQIENPDFESLNKLANSDLINQSNNKLKDEFHYLFEVFWGLKANDDFPDKLYEKTKKVIGLESLNNISFSLEILENFQEFEKVTELEKILLEWMEERLNNDSSAFKTIELFGEVRQSFKNFLATYKQNKKNFPPLLEAIYKRYILDEWSDDNWLSIQNANKEDWEKVLFKEIPEDQRFENMNSSYIIKKVLEQGTDSTLAIKEMITEIYQEKSKQSPFYQKYMSYLLFRLNN